MTATRHYKIARLNQKEILEALPKCPSPTILEAGPAYHLEIE
jgi:hypothetical protein